MPHDYLYNILRQLGASDVVASTAEFLERPVRILLTIVLAVIISRAAARLTRKFISSLGSKAPIQARSDRAPKRANAIASTTAGIAKVIVWAIALPLILNEIGVNLGPFIAGATIIGAALGFGAQSIVKDLLAGFMILTEDQYAVGDTVVVGATTGIVEDVNLLRTRLRSDDGKVWFVANGEIRTVANQSLGWSKAIVELELPYDVDLAHAVTVATDEARALATEPEWADSILAEPEAWGSAVTHDGVMVRVTATTQPALSPRLARAMLARVRSGLQGVPQGVDSEG